MRLRTTEAGSSIQNAQLHFANKDLPCLTKVSLSNVFCNLNTNIYCNLGQNCFIGQEPRVTFMSDHGGKLLMVIWYLLPALSPPFPQQIFSVSSFSFELPVCACLCCGFCGILLLLCNVCEYLDLLKQNESFKGIQEKIQLWL